MVKYQLVSKKFQSLYAKLLDSYWKNRQNLV